MDASRLQGVDDRHGRVSARGEHDGPVAGVGEMGDVGRVWARRVVHELEVGVDGAGGCDEAGCGGEGYGEGVGGGGVGRAEGGEGQAGDVLALAVDHGGQVSR